LIESEVTGLNDDLKTIPAFKAIFNKKIRPVVGQKLKGLES